MRITRARSAFLLACTSISLLLIDSRPSAARVEVGDLAPTQTLYDVEGLAHQVGGSGDSVQLLYFLGSGCTICAEIAKQIDTDIAQQYDDEPLRVLAIDSLDGVPEDVDRLRAESGAHFPFLLDGSALVAAAGISWHSVMIVDAAGKIGYLREGANPDIYDAEEIRDVLDRLLGRAAELQLKTWGEIKQLYERGR